AKFEEQEMTEERFSKRQDRMLLRAMESMVLTQYPNPERKGCPGTAVLHKIATKQLVMRDPVHEHVTSCSPCFRELLDLRAEVLRKRILKRTTTGMVIVFVAIIGYYTFRSPRVTTPPGTSIVESVSLDLREFQTSRSPSAVPGNEPSNISQLPRRPL